MAAIGVRDRELTVWPLTPFVSYELYSFSTRFWERIRSCACEQHLLLLPPPLFSVFSTSPPLFIFLKSNHWFAEALGQNSTVVKPSPTASYTMAPMSSQAAQPTTKVPTHITPTQSTTEKETTIPTTETKPSKLICQFLDASNHFWAYLSVILNSTSPVMSKTNQSAFSL